MKKIYLSLIAAAAITTASAQKPTNVPVGEKASAIRQLPTNGPVSVAKSSAANVIITDTVWYFVNKHNYRNTAANANSFYTFKNAFTYTSTNAINSGGSYFENTQPMIISGAEAILIRQASSPTGTVPVRLYLFNATAGLPTGAPIASCQTGIASSTIGNYVGCNWITPTVVVGDYAIIVKNTSTIPGDTIRMFMNNARTATANISPAGNEQKFGEGFGLLGVGVTFGNTWVKSTDVFSLAPPNTGSDFEFCVAPRVTHTITADNSTSSYSFCNTANIAYANTSSPKISHRQYNLNQFFKSWRPFANTAALAFNNSNAVIQDSVFTWNFGAGPNPTKYDFSPIHQYLLGNGTVSNNMLAKFQKMSDYSPQTTIDTKVWSVTVTVCNVGLTENNIQNQLAVYPNPATDKVTVYLNNVNQNTTIQVLNALGQVVISKSNVSDKNELNTESLSKGVYFVRVTNGKELSTTKLIISN